MKASSSLKARNAANPTWRQQADTTAVIWEYGYDQADQLTSAVKTSTATPATILQRFAYAYDPGGNRTIEQMTMPSHYRRMTT